MTQHYWLNMYNINNITDIDAEELILLNCLQHWFCHLLRTLPSGWDINKFPWTHRSINSTKKPITYPAASTTKIGATVTMLTSIVGCCSFCTIGGKYCLFDLNRIPLSRMCANLWRKLYYIKYLIFYNIWNNTINTLQQWTYLIKRKASVNTRLKATVRL